MGVYFIAAGSSSDNRQKTLDLSHSVDELEPYLSVGVARRLRGHFPDGRGVYLWGANRQGQLPRIREGEHVVDFDDQRVANVFRYCFFISTGSDTRLQRFVGWDEGRRSTAQRRAYPFVYFLRDPVKPRNRDKRFFLRAFGAGRKPHFFDSQLYIGDEVCSAAMRRTGTKSVQELLPLPTRASQVPPIRAAVREPPSSLPPTPSTPMPECPGWLQSVVASVRSLWEQPKSLEREHEHAVALFLQALGYKPASDFRFQRANIDILLAPAERPLAVIEVKADRALAATTRAVLGQALGYAMECGAPIVVVTNGNYYAVFDRRSGLGREQAMIGEFRLLALDTTQIAFIETPRRGVLK